MTVTDVDAILSVMVDWLEAEERLKGVDAIAVRAILALSRAGEQKLARDLMADLLLTRHDDCEGCRVQAEHLRTAESVLP